MKLEIGLELISFLCLRKGAKTPGIRSENRTVINKKQVHLAMLDENGSIISVVGKNHCRDYRAF